MFYNKINIIYGSETTELTPLGRKFREANDLEMREERAADGTLRRDISAHKKRFALSYELIDGNELDVFAELLVRNEPITISIQRRTGNFNNYSVLLQSYDHERESARGDGLYSGFTAEFVEV
jgi:hypothetical protein